MKFPYPKLIIYLGLAICSVGCFRQPSSAIEFSGAERGLLVITDNLRVDLHNSAGDPSGKVFVEFSNGSKSTLWFPVEVAPAYRLDKKSHLLVIWFGYFDEVYGLQKGHFMLPAMHPVQPGEKFKFELVSPSLVENILDDKVKVRIHTRVATKAFTSSRVRNNQPVEEYIDNSIVFDSEDLVVPEDPN